MILLDTHALIWLHQDHKRTRSLRDTASPLYASPVSQLELQLLVEGGRLRFKAGVSVRSFMEDRRWLLDDPPATRWFAGALELAWTRDPFDRLLVAHAQLRGWRLATADTLLLEKLPINRYIEL